MTPPRAWDIAPSLLLAMSGALAALPATTAQHCGAVARARPRLTRPGKAAASCPRPLVTPEAPTAWIGAVSPSPLLLTDAGATRPPIVRRQRRPPGERGNSPRRWRPISGA